MLSIYIAILLLFLFALVLINYMNYFSFAKRRKHHENKHISPKKITIFTIETRPISLVPLHNNNVRAYAERHGYTYDFSDSYTSSVSLPVYWWKLQKMKDLMETDCDYLMWMDSDTMICQHEFRLEHLISLAPDASIFIGKDHFGHVAQRLANYCTGVFMVKNNETGKRFVSDCIDTYMNKSECKENGAYVLNGVWAGPCYEQGVMNALMDTRYQKDVYTVPADYIHNSAKMFDYFLPAINIYDTFILHRFGKNKDRVYHDLCRVATL